MRIFLAFSLLFVLSLGLGALTNAINSHVSPEYYRAILGWDETVDVSRAAIAQGLFESSFYGLGLGVLFAGTVLWQGNRVSKVLFVRATLGSASGALAGWVLGGLFAMALASLSPAFFQSQFFRVPSEQGATLRYAWVGGSIWGLVLGGPLASVLSLISLCRKR